jgi:site-specific recombinase XerD
MRPELDSLPGTLTQLLPSWRRHLRAANYSPKTIASYLGGAERLLQFLRDRGMPIEAGSITREHLESFIEDQLERFRPSTAATRYRDIQQFFKWLVDEGEVSVSPMAKMRSPKLEERPVPIISMDNLQALFRTCEGRSLEDRRDAALLRTLLNTGARLSEVAGMRISDLDLDQEEVSVLGKGKRARWLPLGPKTVKAIDRYLRIRSTHKDAELEWLWLGPRGRLTDSGIAQMIRRRCTEAGIAPIHPHQFRHTFAHLWLSKGGGETDLMKLAGWRSSQMVQRYAASAAGERARLAHKRISPGEEV